MQRSTTAPLRAGGHPSRIRTWLVGLVVIGMISVVAPPGRADASTPLVPYSELFHDPEFNNGVDGKSDLSAGGFIETPEGLIVEIYYDAVLAELSNAKGGCAYLQVNSGDIVRICYDPDSDTTYKITNEGAVEQLAPICQEFTAPEVNGTFSDQWDNSSLNVFGLAEWEDTASEGPELDTIVRCTVTPDVLQFDTDPAAINVCTLQANRVGAWSTSQAKDCSLRSSEQGVLSLNVVMADGTIAADYTLSVVEPLSSQPLLSEEPDATGAITDLTVYGGIYDLASTGPAGYSPSAWSCPGAPVDGAQVTVPPNATTECTVTYTADVVEDPTDTDGDGVTDVNDIDDDNDGIVDTDEGGAEARDTDGDGSPDRIDLDSDNDGISDLVESGPAAAALLADTDGNGTVDPAESPDTDGDGLIDVFEAVLADLAGTTPADTDTDETADYRDLDSDDDTIPDATEWQATDAYVEHDGDVSDEDADGDGISDVWDASTDRGGAIGAPVDTDGDGTPDYRDTDSDDDGTLDADEAGTITAATFVDPDGSVTTIIASLPDTFADTTEVDFREAVAAPPAGSAADTDGDGVTDIYDVDDDNDGIVDADEGTTSNFSWVTWSSISGTTATGSANGVTFTVASTNNLESATSIQGPDFFPAEYGVPNANPTLRNLYASSQTITFSEPVTDPLLAFASVGRPTLAVSIDFDHDIDVLWHDGRNDGWSTVDSARRVTGAEGFFVIKLPGVYDSVGFQYSTDENSVDFAFGADFYNSVDADGDGVTNDVDLDADNDGVSDLIESGASADIVALDTNGNGSLDTSESPDTDGDGLIDAFEAILSGKVGTTARDTDLDDTDDFLDLDSDGDLIGDAAEWQATDAYIEHDGDVSDEDADGDGVSDVWDDAPWFGGAIGDPVDTDGDGLADMIDTNSDDDSLLDAVEATSTGISYADPDGSVTTILASLPDTYPATPEVSFREAIGGHPPTTVTDSDGDGIPDASDYDDDNDGIVDVVEGEDTGFSWATWDSISGNTATGSAGLVTYTLVSDHPLLSTPALFQHSVFPAAYGIPNGNPTIRNDYASSQTLTFSQPVENPRMLFASIGRPSIPVGVQFDQPFTMVWSVDTVVNSSTHLTGSEGFAIVEFTGVFEEISFDYLADEAYANFNFGGSFIPDLDGDGIPNRLDLDSDNDGLSDLLESGVADSVLALDTNGNGSLDENESPDTDNDGIIDVYEPALAGVTGTDPVNTDAVSTGDWLDLDSDGDTIPDAVEWQATAGFIATDGDVSDEDADGDGVADVWDGATWFGGAIGDPVDTDGDGTPDYLDPDSEGDAKPDSTEAGTITGTTYANPTGSVSSISADMPNEIGDTTEVAFREYTPTGWTATVTAPPAVTYGDTPTLVFTIAIDAGTPTSAVAAASADCAATPVYVSGDSDDDGVLDLDETWSYSCVAKPVTAAESDAGSVEYAVSFSGTPLSGTVADATATTTVPVPAVPVVAIDVSTSSTVVGAGGTYTYQFVVANPGNVSLTGLDVTDASCAAAPTFVGGDADEDGQLDMTETWTYTCESAPVTQAEVDAGTVTTTADVEGTGLRGGATATDADTLTLVIVDDPAFTIVKATSSTPTAAGHTLDYGFTVVNTGNLSITAMSFDDESCAADPVLDTESGTADGVISPGETAVYGCTSVAVTQAEVDAGTVDSTVIGSATVPRGAAEDQTADLSVPITPDPDWTLVKAASTTATRAGDTIDYTFTLVNTGNVTISTPSISDDKCAEAPTLTSESIASNATLDAGETQVWECTSVPVTQAEVESGNVHNEATASGTTPGGAELAEIVDPTATHDSEIVAAPAWTLSTAAVGTPAAAGDLYAYTHTLTNTGNVTITAVDLAGDRCVTEPTLLSGDLDDDGALDVGEAWVYECDAELAQSAADAGEVVHEATATGTAAGDLDPATASVTIAVTQSPSLDLVMSSPSAPSRPGDAVVFHFTVLNDGNVSITDLVITSEQCVGAVTLVSESATADEILEVGETQVWSCDGAAVTIDDVNNGEIAASGTVNGTPAGGELESATATTAIPLDAAPSWDLIAVDDEPASEPGGIWVRSFTLVNTGNTDIAAIAIADPRCGETPLLLDDPSGDTVLHYGETQVWQCLTVPLTQAEVDNGQISSDPTASGTASAGVVADATDTITTIIPARPGWRVVKTALTAVTEAGQSVDYAFDLINTGNVSITDIVVTDAKCAADPTLESESDAADEILVAGETQRWGCTSIAVTQAEVDAEIAHNSVSATGTAARGSLDPATGSNDLAIVTNPAFSLTASTASTIVADGDTLDMVFTVTNTGNVTISATAVTSPECASPPVQTGVPADGVVAPGTSIVFTCTTRGVTQDEINDGLMVVDGVASGTPSAGTLADATDSLDVSIDGFGSIRLTVATTTTPTLGSTMDYRFVVVNTGNLTVSDVAVTGDLCTATPTLDSESIAPDGSLAPGETWTLSCTGEPVTQADVDLGGVTLSSTASGVAANDDPVSDTDVRTDPIAQNPAWIVITNSQSSVTEAGQTVRYDYTVTNVGNVTITSGDVADAKCASAPTLIDGAFPAAPGDELSFTCESIAVTQTEVDDGVVTNTPTADGLWGVNPMPQASDSYSIPVSSTPGIEGALAADGELVDADDTTVLRITAVNTGNVTMTTLAVTSPECATTPTSADSGPLAPGAIRTWTCTSLGVTQAEVDAGEMAATATVSATPSGGTVDPAELSIGIPIAPAPSLELTMTASESSVDADTPFEYRFDVVNTGNVTLHDPAVSSPDCAGDAVPLGGAVSALSPGGTAAWTCDAAPPTREQANAGSIVADGLAEATSPADETVDADASVTVPVTAHVGWTLDVVPNDGAGNPPALDAAEQTFDIDLVVDNTGNISIIEHAVSSPSCGATPVYVDGDADGNESLDPGETWTYGCESVPLTQSDVDAGQVAVTGSASGTPARDSLADATGDAIVDVVVAPSITAAKSTTSVATEAGETLDYVVVVTNDGNVTVSDVVIVDPSCATAITLAAPLPAGPIEPGGTQTWTCVSVPVTQDQVDAGLIESEALVEATPAIGDLDAATALLAVPVGFSPSLTLTAEADAVPSMPGGRITYAFSVVNDGNVSLASLTVESASCAAPVVVSTTLLAPGATATGTCQSAPLTAEDFDTGSVAGSATANALAPGDAPVDDSAPLATDLVWEPEITAVADTSTVVAYPGQEIAFDVTVTNSGNVTLTDVHIDDTRCEPAVDHDRVLRSGDSMVFRCAVVATREMIDAGELRLALTSGGTDPADGSVEGPTTAVVPLEMFDEDPRLGTATTVDTSQNADGVVSVTFTLIVENLGNVPLSRLQMHHDLTSVFGDHPFTFTGFETRSRSGVERANRSAEWSTRSIGESACRANPSYDGVTDTALFTGDGVIGIAGGCVVTVRAELLPLYDLDLEVQVAAMATSPAGTQVEDVSVDGGVVDPGADGFAEEASPSRVRLAPQHTSPLPFTGLASVTASLWLASLLIVLGVGLLALRRRSNRTFTG